MIKKGMKRALALLVSLSIIMGGTNITAHAETDYGNAGIAETITREVENTADSARETVFEGDGYLTTFQVQNLWEGGFNAIVTLENTGEREIKNWSLTMEYQGGISNIWNAVIDSSESGTYVIRNAEWNKTFLSAEMFSLASTLMKTLPVFPVRFN